MPLELPYFKFVPTQWLTGNISTEDYETQGLFISICALYWQRSGKVSIDDLYKRYKKSDRLDSLLSGYVSVTDGFISVKFLDEQLGELDYISRVNAANGKKGGRPKVNTGKHYTETKPKLSETKAKQSHIEVDIDIDKEVDNNTGAKQVRQKFTPPTLENITDYLIQVKGMTINDAVTFSDKFWNFYESKNWYVGKNKMQKWKSAIATWLQNPDYKSKTLTPEQRWL